MEFAAGLVRLAWLLPLKQGLPGPVRVSRLAPGASRGLLDRNFSTDPLKFRRRQKLLDFPLVSSSFGGKEKTECERVLEKRVAAAPFGFRLRGRLRPEKGLSLLPKPQVHCFALRRLRLRWGRCRAPAAHGRPPRLQCRRNGQATRPAPRQWGRCQWEPRPRGQPLRPPLGIPLPGKQ